MPSSETPTKISTCTQESAPSPAAMQAANDPTATKRAKKTTVSTSTPRSSTPATSQKMVISAALYVAATGLTA
jgi:hypothetical protein